MPADPAPHAAPQSFEDQLSRSRRALDHARAALAAGTERDHDRAVAQTTLAIEAGLRGEPAFRLLRWLVDFDREAGLDLIYETAVPAGIFDLYDKYFDAAFLARGDITGLLDTIDRTMGGELRTFLPDDVTALREQAIAAGIPPVFINTQPKSGTLFLRAAAEKVLGVPTLPLSVRTFPRDHIVPSYMKIAARGGCLLSEHMDGRRENLDQLAAAGIARVYVQVRDPRQSLISWVHHVADKIDAIYSIGRIEAPIDFPELGLARQIDWMVAHYLPQCVDWIEQWVDAAEHADLTGVAVKVTDFAEMRADGAACVRQLLAHFGLHADGPLPVGPAEAGVNHFRKGELDEWREVCTPEQQAAMTAAVPEALRARFGWGD